MVQNKWKVEMLGVKSNQQSMMIQWPGGLWSTNYVLRFWIFSSANHSIFLDIVTYFMYIFFHFLASWTKGTRTIFTHFPSQYLFVANWTRRSGTAFFPRLNWNLGIILAISNLPLSCRHQQNQDQLIQDQRSQDHLYKNPVSEPHKLVPLVYDDIFRESQLKWKEFIESAVCGAK